MISNSIKQINLKTWKFIIEKKKRKLYYQKMKNSTLNDIVMTSTLNTTCK